MAPLLPLDRDGTEMSSFVCFPACVAHVRSHLPPPGNWLSEDPPGLVRTPLTAWDWPNEPKILAFFAVYFFSLEGKLLVKRRAAQQGTYLLPLGKCLQTISEYRSWRQVPPYKDRSAGTGG